MKNGGKGWELLGGNGSVSDACSGMETGRAGDKGSASDGGLPVELIG